jgi:predicted nucleic acid-binding protein
MTVVDASVVVDWVAPDADPHGPAGRALSALAAAGTDVVGPRLLPEEVANALVTGLRRRRWTGTQADAAFQALRRLPVRLADTSDDLDRAWDLSRRYDAHPLYDMVYVALAERLHCRMVTADESLRRRLALPFVVGPAGL